MLYHPKDFKRDMIFVSGIITVYVGAILVHHPIGCLIERITRIPCPTCGMSSALYHACRLDFDSAFYFHPLFFTVPFILGYYAYESYFRKQRSEKFNWIMATVAVLFVVVYIVRIIWFRETIV